MPSSATASPDAPRPSTCRRSTARCTRKRCRSGCWRTSCRGAFSCRFTSTSGRPTHVGSRQSQEQPAAVLLLSGGLDSYTAGAIAREEGFRLHALTVRYGQRHARELESARAVGAALGVVRHI